MSASDEGDSLPPFPVLMDDPEPWRWPAPPFDWRHATVPELDVAQACRVEAASGATVDAVMLGIDVQRRSLRLRNGADPGGVELPFSRFRRITLDTPLKPLEQRAGVPAATVPLASHEREYRLQWAGTGQVETGRTAGHVETADGLFLFAPMDDGESLLRSFVPRWAYLHCTFGPTAQDLAAERWIATPRHLLEALERQRHMPVLPIGQSLRELGLVTQAQLDRALAEERGNLPLGERLVAQGVITEADLHTAIAHKMGYPYVDLTRFPIDPAAARKLPPESAAAHRALPIMIHQQQLMVAVDRPQRAVGLQGLYGIVPFTVVPVLASKVQILLAVSALARQDVWSESTSIRAGLFSTTR